jgi:hypothetical protein
VTIGFLSFSIKAKGNERNLDIIFDGLTNLNFSQKDMQSILEESVTKVASLVSHYCRKQNIANKAAGKVACDQDHCLDSAIVSHGHAPIDISLNAGYSTQRGMYLSLEIQFQWGPEQTGGSAAFCYHPRLSPMVMTFRRDLASKLWQL